MIHRLLARAADRFTRTGVISKPGASAEPRVTREQRQRERAARKSEQLAAKHHEKALRQQRRAEAAVRAEASRRALDAAGARACQHYPRVRDWARAAHRRDIALTAVEKRIADALAPLWNADAGTIANLRRWAEPIGGIRAADYAVPSSELGKRIRRDLKRLYVEVGADLFVAESPLLGGFGFTSGGQRYNDDTVKFFNVLVALRDGAVLDGIRNATDRRLVWEVGGGWGGFAYQFKTICPNTTYVITGTPELLLLSAVYLMTVFPDARCRFHGASSCDDVWQGWQEADFIFALEPALSELRPPRLDLAIDVTGLRDMSLDRMATHVQWAFEQACPYFYSLEPGGSSGDVPDHWNAIGRFYWLQPVAPRVEPTKVERIDYSHVIGWKRLRL
jgi:hypothetical protein